MLVNSFIDYLPFVEENGGQESVAHPKD